MFSEFERDRSDAIQAVRQALGLSPEEDLSGDPVVSEQPLQDEEEEHFSQKFYVMMEEREALAFRLKDRVDTWAVELDPKVSEIADLDDGDEESYRVLIEAMRYLEIPPARIQTITNIQIQEYSSHGTPFAWQVTLEGETALVEKESIAGHIRYIARANEDH